MNFLKKIKRFCVRKILRRVYDPKEILDMPLSEINFAEIKLLTEVLYTGMIEAEKDLMRVVDYVSEIPTPCDKCSDIEVIETYCFKCEGTGIIKNKHLCSWPWED